MYATQKPNIVNDECTYLSLLTMGKNPETEFYMGNVANAKSLINSLYRRVLITD